MRSTISSIVSLLHPKPENFAKSTKVNELLPQARSRAQLGTDLASSNLQAEDLSHLIDLLVDRKEHADSRIMKCELL